MNYELLLEMSNNILKPADLLQILHLVSVSKCNRGSGAVGASNKQGALIQHPEQVPAIQKPKTDKHENSKKPRYQKWPH
eukprot:9368794-Karenia_brevis.AAC.1